MRVRCRLILTLFWLFMFTSTGIASAQGMLNGELCSIEADEVIEGDLFILCGELIIEGRVTGSVIGGAREALVTPRGQVDGSVYLFGGELTVEGTLGKDIHWAGISLDVRDSSDFLSTNSSLISVNLSNTIHRNSIIPGNITNLGYQLIVNGDVGGEINFWGSALNIGGFIGQDVTATVGNSESDGASSQIETLLIPFPFEVELIDPGLIIAPPEDAQTQCEISGDLTYTGANPGDIRCPVGNVGGIPEFNSTTTAILPGTPVEQSARSLSRYLNVVFREFMALAFIGILCVAFIPRYIQAPVRTLQTYPLSTLGIGLLSFILSFPVILIFALFSVLLVILLTTLPILDNVVLFGGVVLGLVNVGGASIFYFTAIYIGRVVVALAIGRFLLRLIARQNVDYTHWQTLGISMGVGVLILSLAGAVPVIGFGLNALALFLGLGAILSILRLQMKQLRTPVAANPTTPSPIRYEPDPIPSLPYLADEAQQYAPPIIDNDPPAAGMDNLPDGFDWWQSDLEDNDGS